MPLKIGILGGTFNPAHFGHLSISIQALNYYNFDYVIWLVANQNPLKTKSPDIFFRARKASEFVEHPKIIVSTAEYDLNYTYSFDSLSRLIKIFPSVRFTWLAGIDNISNFHRWYRNKELLNLCDIIIFDRPCTSRMINFNTLYLNKKAVLAKNKSSNIIIHRGRLCDLSSTAIRSNKFTQLPEIL